MVSVEIYRNTRGISALANGVGSWRRRGTTDSTEYYLYATQAVVNSVTIYDLYPIPNGAIYVIDGGALVVTVRTRGVMWDSGDGFRLVSSIL